MAIHAGLGKAGGLITSENLHKLVPQVVADYVMAYRQIELGACDAGIFSLFRKQVRIGLRMN